MTRPAESSGPPEARTPPSAPASSPPADLPGYCGVAAAGPAWATDPVDAADA